MNSFGTYENSVYTYVKCLLGIFFSRNSNTSRLFFCPAWTEIRALLIFNELIWALLVETKHPAPWKPPFPGRFPHFVDPEWTDQCSSRAQLPCSPPTCRCHVRASPRSGFPTPWPDLPSLLHPRPRQGASCPLNRCESFPSASRHPALRRYSAQRVAKRHQACWRSVGRRMVGSGGSSGGNAFCEQDGAE